MSDLTDRTQYERLSQDWRQIHNVIWGIPSVAISVISAVIIVAYQLEGWSRILTLGIGSIFLFSMTVEIVKKRLTMDAISARMQSIELKIGQNLTFGPFPSKTNRLIIELYEAQRLKEEKEREDRKNRELVKGTTKEKAEGTRDIPYKLFKLSHARASLTYVLFAAAILASVLTYWEFISYLKFEWWSYVVAIIPVISISIVVAISIKRERNDYKEEKEEYEKKRKEKKRLDHEKEVKVD